MVCLIDRLPSLTNSNEAAKIPAFPVLLIDFCFLKFSGTNSFIFFQSEILPRYFLIILKPSSVVKTGSFGIDIKDRLQVLEVNEPPERKPGIKVDDVEALVNKLKNEAKVL